MSEWMEYGDSGWVALPNGWLQEINTGNKMDPEGRVYDRHGSLIWNGIDDDEEEDYSR